MFKENILTHSWNIFVQICLAFNKLLCFSIFSTANTFCRYFVAIGSDLHFSWIRMLWQCKEHCAHWALKLWIRIVLDWVSWIQIICYSPLRVSGNEMIVPFQRFLWVNEEECLRESLNSISSQMRWFRG